MLYLYSWTPQDLHTHSQAQAPRADFHHTQAVAGNGIAATTSYDVATTVNGVTTSTSGSQSTDSGDIVQANAVAVKDENGQVVVRAAHG